MGVIVMVMKEQDKRAVESLCSCGLGFEDVCKSFPEFSVDELKEIYISIRNDDDISSVIELKMNCS